MSNGFRLLTIGSMSTYKAFELAVFYEWKLLDMQDRTRMLIGERWVVSQYLIIHDIHLYPDLIK